MFTRSLMSWSDGDWLTTRVDKWAAQWQGYSKLRSRRLSKGCQTMLLRSSPQTRFCTRSGSELLDSALTEPTTTDRSDDNVIISSLNLDGSNVNGNVESGISNARKNLNLIEKQMQYDQDIADYIAYLNKPIINMNDHYIEIHQYHYEAGNIFGGQFSAEVPIRPPTRRKKHKIDMKKTEIVDYKRTGTIKGSEYSEFLVKKGQDPNQNIKVVRRRSSDEENKAPAEGLDHHRPLSQSAVGRDRGVDTVINKEGQVRLRRQQTFTNRSSAKPVTDLQRDEPPPRGFLSFRTAKRNKSGRRKKIVVGEDGINGPIWPAVLLTFDRSVSPGPPEFPDESEV